MSSGGSCRTGVPATETGKSVRPSDLCQPKPNPVSQFLELQRRRASVPPLPPDHLRGQNTSLLSTLSALPLFTSTPPAALSFPKMKMDSSKETTCLRCPRCRGERSDSRPAVTAPPPCGVTPLLLSTTNDFFSYRNRLTKQATISQTAQPCRPLESPLGGLKPGPTPTLVPAFSQTFDRILKQQPAVSSSTASVFCAVRCIWL